MPLAEPRSVPPFGFGIATRWLSSLMSRDRPGSRSHGIISAMRREPSEVTPSLKEGDQVAGYVIEQRIGIGGFGEVYRARHPVIGREVAIKVLHGNYSADPEAVSRFVAEARSVNQISHPNIVEAFD